MTMHAVGKRIPNKIRWTISAEEEFQNEHLEPVLAHALFTRRNKLEPDLSSI